MPDFNLKPTLRAYTHSAYACGIVEQPAITSPLLNLNIQWAFPFAKHQRYGPQFDFNPALYLIRCAPLGILDIRAQLRCYRQRRH